MNIRLAASVDFSWETIDSLVEGIQDVFPTQVKMVKKVRFRVDKKKIASSRKDFMAANPFNFFMKDNCYIDWVRNDEVPDREVIYFNLQRVYEQHESKRNGGLLMIMFGRPFMFPNPNPPLYDARWAGPNMKGRIYYSGLFYRQKNLAIVGLETSPSGNNIKLACHEIAHSVLGNDDHNDGNCSDSSPDHCTSKVKGGYCIMNSQGCWKEEVDLVYLGFCKECKTKICRSV
ncbi:MAG: hypothetical protein AABX52_04415 [Nanoarchaeota archaeon]